LGLEAGRLQWRLTTPFLASVLLLAFNQYTSWGRQVLILSLVAALAVYALGRHWSAVCASSPVFRSRAEQLRQEWQPQLILLAAITGLLVVGLLWTGSLLFQAAFLVLPATALLLPRPAGQQSRWRVFADSLGSWFTYEARSLPGLFQSPVGLVRHR
jgi:hypothetical protein